MLGQLWTPEYERMMEILEHIQCRLLKMMKELLLLYEERMRVLGLLRLDKRRLQGIVSMCVKL